LICILSLRPEILSSTCSSLLKWLSTVFFILFKENFISRISVWLLFLRLSIHFLKSYFIPCAVFFIS
jgi:hypothetical protein